MNHFDQEGNAIMIDVTAKDETIREAVARGSIQVSKEVMEAICQRKVHKGDVLGVARVAGIMGVKKTFELIPMCHILLVTKCHIDFEIDEETLSITAICRVKTQGKTGVEMEALTGVNIALLTIYDMCKAIDKRMVISNIYLEEKSGGKSGHFKR